MGAGKEARFWFSSDGFKTRALRDPTSPNVTTRGDPGCFQVRPIQAHPLISVLMLAISQRVDEPGDTFRDLSFHVFSTVSTLNW